MQPIRIQRFKNPKVISFVEKLQLKMYTTKATIVALALVAGLVCVQAAGGIKGLQQSAGQFRPQAIKGPAALRPTFQQQQQQTYFAPAPAPAPLPAPAPAPVFLPAPAPAPLPAPAPVVFQQQAIKAGPGNAAPVFSAIRVQPAAPAPLPAPQVFAPIQQVQQQVQVQEQEPDSQQQQVQSQAPDQEVDPSAAAQEGTPALVAPARVVPAAVSEEEANPRPEPYAFQYGFNSGDQATSGSSQREEQQDASGRVTGFYTLKGEDGRDRRVDYVADAGGFRATISTNELGTANKDSADVDWTAASPSEAQLRAAESATQAARQRTLLSPAQNQQQFQQQQQQLQQQPASQAQLSFGSSSLSTSQQKFSSPRQRVAAAAAASQSQQQQQPSKANSDGNQQQVQVAVQQLQEPFEQIRQTEFQGRARKSRHAPFYLFTI